MSRTSAQSTAEDAIVRTFRIDVPEEDLVELRRRIVATRWPDKETVADHSQGVQLATIQELARYWATDYDWRKCEARLNTLAAVPDEHRRARHPLHSRPLEHEDALPLIVTHGWPGSVIEQLKIIEPLTNPTAHDASASDAFHLVIPSMPGYGFSEKPSATGWDPARVARAWVGADAASRIHPLCGARRRLGWADHRADGRSRRRRSCSVSTRTSLATVPPEIEKALQAGEPPPPGLAAEERRAYEQLLAGSKQRGYAVEMGDAPANPFRAWRIPPSARRPGCWTTTPTSEEQRSHTPYSAGTLSARLTRDDVLDNISLYWLTNTGVSSARLYWENKFAFFAVKNISDTSRGQRVPRRALPGASRAGPRRPIPSSSTSTNSTQAATSRPGSSPNSSRKRSAPHPGRFAREAPPAERLTCS